MNLGKFLFNLRSSIYEFTDNSIYDMYGNTAWFSVRDSVFIYVRDASYFTSGVAVNSIYLRSSEEW